MKIVKRVLLGLLAVVVVIAGGAGIYACVQVSRFDASMEVVYDIPPLPMQRSTDPAVIARGKHLAEAVAPCSNGNCHGSDLGGGKTFSMGPLATFTGPNITPGGLGAAYTDGELARVIRHGVKKDGRSLRFMPAQDVAWLPDTDVVAIISYVRSVPAVDRAIGPTQVRTLGKILDRREAVELDVARHIDHSKTDLAPPPSPTADYGRFVARICTGCHGRQLSGGPMPGAPPSLPAPLNLTPHETGLKAWTYEDFDKLLTQAIRKNGEKLKPFMPVDSFGKMDETEKKALFAYLQTLPPIAYGNR